MLRVGMTNPPYILDQLDKVCAALRHPRAFRFLHVPVQSGSDSVLKGMNREYTAAEFRRVADALTQSVPGLTLATDIIAGFPGETDEQWEETMALCARYKFPVTNISQFYPRPGTPAARMKRVDTRIVKERSRALTRAFTAYAPYAALEGTREAVWVGTEKSKDGRRVGHTRSYVKVLLDPAAVAVGSIVEVDLIRAHRWHMDGAVVKELAPTPASTQRLLADNEAWLKKLEAADVAPSSSCSGSCSDEQKAACGCSEGGCDGEAASSACAEGKNMSECCGGIAPESACGEKGKYDASGSSGGCCMQQQQMTPPPPPPARTLAKAYAVEFLAFLGLQLLVPSLCMLLFARIRGCDDVGDVNRYMGYR
uniref:tRNA (N(6)-L-threonylcarbamoyladenosine(37)-C(2))-methylthiotransferase n=2 Tax=Phaeomonas parva TaxID=124430 RepID=A0A7S1U0U7_9STRA|mmetsp:Transcript_26528/g.82948  ORF Transcript_26528/g.82948 Transcript_26528/m.82948 type:complete len:367 (+) Transcript_26528:86-1186(+)